MEQKRVFGLVGRSISYSFSRKYFSEKFALEKLNYEYLNFDIPFIARFPELLTTENLRGLNITIPYKEVVMPFLDNISEDAAAIGAVNTIRIDNGKLTGFNTDWIGFRDSVKPLLQQDHQKALILGTGGASKAVAHAFKNLKIPHLFVSRTNSNNTITYQDIDASILSEYKMIVNCTPVGTSPDVDKSPLIPFQLLDKSHLLYDLIYNPEQTLFLKKGNAAGASTKNGLEMLVLQAEQSWRIWNE